MKTYHHGIIKNFAIFSCQTTLVNFTTFDSSTFFVFSFFMDPTTPHGSVVPNSILSMYHGPLRY